MKLGILGGGQLAKMLTLAAAPLGIHTICIDPSPNACAGLVTELIEADFDDETALSQLIRQVDCVTFENENIPLSSAEFISKQCRLHPSVEALKVSQDRLSEKLFFQSLNIPTAKFIAIDTENTLMDAIKNQPYLPSILKTRRFGYDGKGQFVIRTEQDISTAWDTLQTQSLILEKFVSFERELSLIAIRDSHGDIRFYPLTKNDHHQGILSTSEAPFQEVHLQQEAEKYATDILKALNYVGVLAIEFFFDGKKLIANEMAPRVHNTGHWTIEGAMTSQFENHLRAIFGLPLGSTEAIGQSFLMNCIGEMPSLAACLSITGCHYHQYGKTPRKGRKLGHVTLVDQNEQRYKKSKHLLGDIVRIIN